MTLPDPGTYTVESLWTVVYHTTIPLQADCPEAALDRAREMVRDGAWFGHPEAVEGSEGAIRIAIWSEGMTQELLVDPQNDDVRVETDRAELAALHAHYPVLRKALKDVAHNRRRIHEDLNEEGQGPDAEDYLNL